MSSHANRRDRQSPTAEDVSVRPSAVGGTSLTQRHVDRRDSRAGDHAVLDAAWGVVQRDVKKPTAGPSWEDRGGEGALPEQAPAPTDMKGRVIEHRIVGGKVLVRTSLGAKSGARPEMEGYLHNGDGKPKYKFKVQDLDVDTSWMILDEHHLDTVRQYKQVLLNPAKESSGGKKPVQKAHDQHSGLDDDGIRSAAAHGIAGSGGSLPHLDAIQRSFGAHDVTGVRAHVGGAAKEASAAMGAHAYATGNDVAFAESPSLFLAAHEAAHVVQQRAGVHLSSAVGQDGDAYEQHADAVAARVVAGESAEDLLGAVGGAGTRGVQRKEANDDKNPKGSKLNPTLMVVNSYGLVFNNQRAGLTRLGAALKKDSAPDSSLIADIAGNVVGGVIGAVLGPAGTFAGTFATTATGKAIVAKVASVVTAKAVEVGSATAKEHFSTKKTDPADNFVERQTVAINKAEHAAVQEFLKVTKDTDSVDGPEPLEALSAGLEHEAAFAADREVAYSAGAWARQNTRPWGGLDASAKGDIEIEATVSHRLAVPLTILKSNWHGVGKETEQVVQEHPTARIAELGVPLYVTLHAPHGETWFRALDERNVHVPRYGSIRDWLIHAAFRSVPSGNDSENLAAAENAARMFAFQLLNMQVGKLGFK